MHQSLHQQLLNTLHNFNADKSSSVSSSDKAIPDRPKKARLRRAAALVYESLLRQATEADDDEESDSNDETFEGGENHSSDEEAVNGIDESSNDGEWWIWLCEIPHHHRPLHTLCMK